MNNKTLHIGIWLNFLPPFIEFVKDNFDFKQHEFLLTRVPIENQPRNEPIDSNVFLAKKNRASRWRHWLRVIIKMHQANKVILHGLFESKLILILFFMPWLLKKCYWVIWGGDLYCYQLGTRNWKWMLREFFRRPVIKNMAYLVTYIKGDYELAQQWYDAKGQYQECFMYTSNLYKEYDVTEKKGRSIDILVGNSADPSNNHLEVFDKLDDFKDQDIKIYTPLSYGDKDYALKIATEGRRRFGNKFYVMEDFMPFDKYLEFLSEIDIAIFNHKRQQAMGNTITLLGLGKKVYLRSDVTQWDLFNSNGIAVYDIKEFVLNDNKNNQLEENKRRVKAYFSEQTLVNQLREVFN